jgi:hypothetical protein
MTFVRLTAGYYDDILSAHGTQYFREQCRIGHAASRVTRAKRSPNMRILVATVFSACMLGQAQAAPSAYDLYLLACDGHTDCRRVATLVLGADGQKNDYPTPGVNVRIEQLSALPEGAVIRVALSLNPAQLAAAGTTASRGKAGQVSIEVDSTILRQDYYSPLVVFSTSGRVYQLWGRQVGVPTAAKSLALR